MGLFSFFQGSSLIEEIKSDVKAINLKLTVLCNHIDKGHLNCLKKEDEIHKTLRDIKLYETKLMRNCSQLGNDKLFNILVPWNDGSQRNPFPFWVMSFTQLMKMASSMLSDYGIDVSYEVHIIKF